MSSGGGLTSWPTCDPEAECWLSRTTKAIHSLFVEMAKNLSEEMFRTRLAENSTARWYSSHNIYCEAHAVWEEAELTFLTADLGGSCLLCRWPPLTHRVTHGLSLQGFISLNQPPLWHSSERSLMLQEALTAFLGKWPCLTFHVM